MDQLTPDYFGELGRQLAFVAAVLGGFAATFFGTLLTNDSPTRVAGFATGSAAVAAASFVCTTLIAISIILGNHPDAPASVAAGSASTAARVALVVTMMIGVYALCAATGAAGWLRSRQVGLVTTGVAVVASAIATWAFAGF